MYEIPALSRGDATAGESCDVIDRLIVPEATERPAGERKFHDYPPCVSFVCSKVVTFVR